jgi:hypothetical protein
VGNLIRLLAATVAVPYLNDSSMHEQIVRAAIAQLPRTLAARRTIPVSQVRVLPPLRAERAI